MRDGPWKLVIDRHDGTPGSPMLFNLDDDLGEQEDLAAAYPGRVERLVAVLGAWRADVGATP